MPVRDNKTTHRSLYTCEGCCANYRAAVGHLRTDTIHQFYLNMPIRGPYCMNYRVAVGHLGTNAIQLLYLNTPISDLYCINYHVAVGIMVSSCILVLRKTYGILIPILLIIYEFGITINL